MLFLLNIGFLLFILFSILAAFPVVNAVSEILSNFWLQYFLFSLFFLIIYIILKQWKSSLCALVLMLYFAFPILNLLSPPSVVKNEKFEDIVLLQFNINYRHTDVKKVVDWINDLNCKKVSITEVPDIVLIQEATPEITEKFDDILKFYPYKISGEKVGAYGMLLYSKIPIAHHERRPFEVSANEYTIAYMHTPLKKIPFILIELHSISPSHFGKSHQRPIELSEIAQISLTLGDKNKIVFGDLNTTPYSPYLKQLEKVAKLANSMKGHDIFGTWPSFLPNLLRIPLDNLLVSSRIEVLKRDVLPDLGSDHLPVNSKLRVYVH